MRRFARATLFLVLSAGTVALADAGCGGSDDTQGPKPEAGPDDAGVNGDASWTFKTYACPAPTGSFPEGKDKWSPLVSLKRADGLNIPPIHVVLLENGKILAPGANMRATPKAGIIEFTSNFMITPEEPTEDKTITLQEVTSPHLGADENFFCSGHGHLADGRVLMAGGNKEGTYCDDAGVCAPALLGLDYGEIFDPATESFTLLDQKMLDGKRWYPTVTRLPDGRMMVTAGDSVSELVKNHSAETFDDKTLTWSQLSDEANTPKEVEIHAHYVHVYSLPKSIEVEGMARDTLVLGEYGHMFLMNSAPALGNSAARWARRTPRPGPESVDIVKAHGATSALLPLIPRNGGRFNQGSVLVIGGSEDLELEKTVQVYDPFLDTWCPTAFTPLDIPRFQPSTVLLPDGNVLLIAGGPYPTEYTENAPQRAPQILDPRTGAVWNGSPWPDPYTRGYHNTSIVLPDARVIIAGGRTFEGGEPDITNNWDERTDMRYYYPPYFTPIFAGKPRPSIDSVPAAPMTYGAPMQVGYSKGPIDMVAVMALGSQTHCVDMDARHVQLEYTGGTEENGSITLTGPLDAATAPPGKYMLFLLHKIDGWLVPSVAKMVTIK